jgi:FtsP/CotA-like multicopper oxidase with cupredoxin domain
MTRAASTAASPKSNTRLRTPNAPFHAGTSPNEAQIGRRAACPEMTRRALIGGVFCVALFGRAEAEPLRLTAGSRGYNGTSPGPALRLRAGERLDIRLVNGLAEPTSLCLPGSRFPAPIVAPGETRDFVFAPTAPGFGLYAPWRSAGAGLFGAYVVEELAPPAVNLDAIVVLPGVFALAAPPGGRVRLRLANAAPDAVLGLKASGATVTIVAIDGAPSEPFTPRGGEFPMCPGARFELMFDLDGPFELAGARSAVRIEPKGERVAPKGPIAALPANPRLPAEIALEKARQIRIAIGAAALNGVGGSDWPAKPLFSVAKGTPVALTLVNERAEPQTLRLEGHLARVLHALDDGWDPYWRDALLIGPGRTLHAAFVADNSGKWPLASASPERRAKGMAGWFEVT